jgi:prepilin-type N-terminal cleavage/methylation domain-containing protein
MKSLMATTRTRGFTLLETMIVVFLSALVFAGAFTLIWVCSDTSRQVSSLIQFKRDAYRARRTLSQEIREASLVNIEGAHGDNIYVTHSDGRVSRFQFTDPYFAEENRLLYWRDISDSENPEVLAEYISANDYKPFITRIRPMDDLSGTLPIPDPTMANNNLLVISFRIGETSDFTYGGFGGTDIQGVEVQATILLRNATQTPNGLAAL